MVLAMVTQVTMPDDLRDHVGWLRDRATRLVALALRVREGGDGELSEQFVIAALACEDEATALEIGARRNKKPRTSNGGARHVQLRLTQCRTINGAGRATLAPRIAQS